MRLRHIVGFVAFALAIVTPATAIGAVRYAAPNGNGPQPCAQGDPCALRDAVEDAGGGDEVVVGIGNYTLGAPLTVGPGVVVRGPSRPPRPLIVSTALDGVVVSGNATLRDLDIEHDGDGAALRMRGGLAERVTAHTTGGDQFAGACEPTAGTLRDSVCWRTGTGAAVRAECNGNCSGDVEVRNVTAVAAQGVGAIVAASGGAHLRLIVRNSILNGTSGGNSFDVQQNGGWPDSRADMILRYSNFYGGISSGPGILSGFGGGANQTAEPAFVDAANGNFHQRANSSTIDAGGPDPLLGALDIDGQLRTQDGAADIGADEFPDSTPPQTGITGAPKRKLKTAKRRKRVAFGFESNEPGSSFECKLDGDDEFASCESPFKARVKAGGGKGRKHRFQVRAVDAVGNVDGTPSKKTLRVKRKPGR